MSPFAPGGRRPQGGAIHWPAGGATTGGPSTGATVLLEVEFSGIGNGWTDLTPDLTSDPIQISRGFQSDAPDDLVAAPATCQFGLNNASTITGGEGGLFSPDSPTVTHPIAPGQRARVTVTANGTPRVRFLGFIQSITPMAGLFTEQTVAIMAASWLQLASTTYAQGVSAQVNQRGDELLATLVALATFPPPAVAFGPGSDTYPYAFDDLDPSQNSIIDGCDSIARSGFDRIWEAADGTLHFEPRSVREAGTASALTISDVAPPGKPGLALTALPVTRALTDLYNRVQLTGHPKAVDASNVVLFSFPLTASQPTIAAGETVTIAGPYVDPNQQAQQVGGFALLIDDGMGGEILGTSGPLPAADFQFTSAPGGGGLDLSSQFVVTVVYDARQATFTITNNSASLGYYALLQCRGRGIYNYVDAIGVKNNPDSLSAFGGKNLTIDCPYQADPAFLDAAAAYVVAVYGPSRSSIAQGLKLFVNGADEITMSEVLAIEISDPITVQETVTAINTAVWVNHVTEAYDERMNLTLTWGCGPRLFQNPWTLGTSRLSVDTVLAFF